MATKPSQSPQDSSEKFEKFLSSSDEKIDGWVTRLGNRFSRSPWSRKGFEFFEPAISGFAVAAVLWLLDALNAHVNGAQLFNEFVNSSVHHAKPLAFVLGLLTIGLALLAPQSELGSVIRRLVSSPILRFSHHASLLAGGALLLATIRQWAEKGLTSNDLLIIGLASIFLVQVAGISFAANWYITSETVRRWEASRVFRWISIAVGVLLLVLSYKSFEVLASEVHPDKTHSEVPAAQAPTPSAGTSKH